MRRNKYGIDMVSDRGSRQSWFGNTSNGTNLLFADVKRYAGRLATLSGVSY